MAAAGFVGQRTVGQTAVALAASAVACRVGVVVKALAANTGKIYVGLTDAVTTSTGFELNPKEQMSFDTAFLRALGGTGIGDLVNLYLISDTASQGVSYWGV